MEKPQDSTTGEHAVAEEDDQSKFDKIKNIITAPFSIFWGIVEKIPLGPRGWAAVAVSLVLTLAGAGFSYVYLVEHPVPRERTTLGGVRGDKGASARAIVMLDEEHDDSSTPELGRPVRIGIRAGCDFAPALLSNNGLQHTKESLFWRKYGIEVELKLLEDHKTSREALRKGGDHGGVDIVWGSVASYTLEYPEIKDLKPKAFMLNTWSRGKHIVAVRHKIEEAADLRGKKVALVKGSPAHYFALYLLDQAKIEPSEVQWSFVHSEEETFQALRLNRVDVAVGSSQRLHEYATIEPGVRVLTSTKEASSLIAGIFIARGDFAAKYPNVIARFTLGWFESVQDIKGDPAIVLNLMDEFFPGTDIDEAEEMLNKIKLADHADNMAFFELSNTHLKSYDDIHAEASRLWSQGKEPLSKIRMEQTVDTGFLHAVHPESEKRFGAINARKNIATREFSFDPDDNFREDVRTKQAVLTRRIPVFFPTGDSRLHKSQHTRLDEAARLAQTFGASKIRITTNTDNIGNRLKNIEISQKRAKSIADYLVYVHRFPRNKFVIMGMGPDRPIADNTTLAGRETNRRTDFEIIP